MIQLPMQCSIYLVINYGSMFTYVKIHGCKDLEVYFGSLLVSGWHWCIDDNGD